MHIQEEVGVGKSDGGTHATCVYEVVDDGILHTISHELGMGEIFAIDCGVYGEGGGGCHILLPLDLADHIIEIIRIVGGKFLDWLKNSQGSAAT